MNGGFLVVTVVKDLRRRLRDLPSLLIWLGLPLMIGALLGLLTIDSGGVPRGTLLLVDEDESLLTSLLAGAAGRGELGGILGVEKIDHETGLERMEKGQASALLIVPEGFQEAALAGTPAELTLIENPAQRIFPKMIEEGLGLLVDGLFYVQQLFGEPLQQIVAASDSGRFPDDALVADIARQMNQRIQELDGVVLPPVITVRLDRGESDTGQSFDFGTMFLPGMIFMSILFVTSGVAGDLWDERVAGTLRRFLASPRPIAVLLAGKVLTAGILAGGAALVGLFAGAALLGLSWLRVAPACAWSALVGMSLFSLFLLLQTLATSQRTAGLLTNLVVFPLIMIGGSFFPLEAMPQQLAAMGRWTPNGAGVVVLRQIVEGAVDPATFVGALSALLVLGVLSMALCARRVGGAFARTSAG